MKNLMYFFLLLGATQAFSTDYYVSTTGSNSNTGLSASAAWSDIQYAVDQATAGDHIYVLGGVYNELIEFNNSGNAVDGYIVLQAYDSNTPIIDATGLATGAGSLPAIIKIIDQSYIEVIGFEIRNLSTGSSSQFPSGIWIRGDAHHVEINNNKVHSISHTAATEGAHAIAVYGTKSSGSIHDVSIINNEVYDCVLAFSEALVLNGNVEDFIVNNNLVHDNNNIGIDFIGHEGTCPDPLLDQARNGECIGNLVYNIDSRTNPAYNGEASAGGIYVDGGKNILIEHNEVHHANIGIEIASEWQNQSTSEITVRNNIIHNCHVVGFAIGGYDANRGETRDCNIVNNTFYNNDTDNVGWGAEILFQYYCFDNVINNNIFYAKDNGYLISYYVNSGSNNDFDHNVYYNTGSVEFSWSGTYYGSFLDFKNGTGNESNGAFQDPNFVQAGNADFQLNNGSVAIDLGNNLGSSIIGTQDFYSNLRVANGTVDVGAHEYGSTSDAHIEVSPNCIEIFPNPFTDMVVIQGDFSNHSIEILNQSGQVVQSLTGTPSPISIDIPALPSGTHFIYIQHNSDPAHYLERIIKL